MWCALNALDPFNQYFYVFHPQMEKILKFLNFEKQYDMEWIVYYPHEGINIGRISKLNLRWYFQPWNLSALPSGIIKEIYEFMVGLEG